MNRRKLLPSGKKAILNRDGWCCNHCGYVPFHTNVDVPFWARKSYNGFYGFVRDLELQQPVIFVVCEILQDDNQGNMYYNIKWLHGGELEFDHIVSVKEGGSLSLDNIQALCHDCHRIKTNMESRYTEPIKYTIHKFMGRLAIVP